MAGSAHLRIFPSECSRIEAWAVRVEASASQRRMAGQTVALGMTCDAALQILPCRLAMAQQKGTPRIVITCVQLSSSAQPGVYVAVGAELRVVVAVAAVRFPRV